MIVRIVVAMLLIVTSAFAGNEPECSSPPGYKINMARSGQVRSWPNNTVPYEFSPGITDEQKRLWLDAAMEWTDKTKIKFVKHTNEVGYLYVTSRGGNWSHVGYHGRRQEISIVNWYYKFIIVHEIGHALLLQHEQSRPDRDKYVNIHTENISQGRAHNFLKFEFATYGPYDYDSVMHYRYNAFTSNGHMTIETLDKSYQYKIGQRTHISYWDAIEVMYMYGIYTPPTQPDIPPVKPPVKPPVEASTSILMLALPTIINNSMRNRHEH